MAIRCDESDISAAEKSAHGILSEFSYRGEYVGCWVVLLKTVDNQLERRAAYFM